MMKLTPPDVPRRHRPWGMEILHEDRDILVIHKEVGLLTMSFRREEGRTAEQVLNQYVRKGNPRSPHRVFVVHRLDRDTSGLLVFAKSLEAQRRLKAGWGQTEKLYLAAVHGTPEPPRGLYVSRLVEDKDQFVHVADDPSEGRLAETAYSVIKTHRGISLVRVTLLTGRKNQIRVHFAEAGFPVVGDLKYCPISTSRERLALHAKVLAFDHPYHGQRVRVDAGIPEVFARLGGGLTESEWQATPPPGSTPVPMPAPRREQVSAPAPRRNESVAKHRPPRRDRPARPPRRP